MDVIIIIILRGNIGIIYVNLGLTSYSYPGLAQQILSSQAQFEIRTPNSPFSPANFKCRRSKPFPREFFASRNTFRISIGMKLLNCYQIAETWNFEVNSGYN
ncbi:hypothetical protein MTR67_033148 [Solanum verrucosum]|uniref:Uncharacterized protein n=1 Tax=Solanum verrucosum TaxID=315347 RepID=A0AAF0U5T7_SOLVR|nr:hypothetical protein MTR67_033148 [Solanum verrucosum]